LGSAFEALALAGTGLKRRFAVKSPCIFSGVFHLDGTFNGAARYRHCKRNNVWFLKYFDSEGKAEWRFAGNGEAKRCTMVSLGLPADAPGRDVLGIEEIPGPEAWARGTGYTEGSYFRWIDDICCGDPYPSD
jgi:hypothetical protein